MELIIDIIYRSVKLIVFIVSIEKQAVAAAGQQDHRGNAQRGCPAQGKSSCK